jgi:aquaglyceroporin related protein
MSGLKVEEHKEHNEHINGSASGSNSPQSLYFEKPKVTQVPHTTPSPHASAEHGPLVDHLEMKQNDETPARPDLWWSRQRAFMIEPFSEFFGVFIMILFGDGVVGMSKLSSVCYISCIAHTIFSASCPV